MSVPVVSLISAVSSAGTSWCVPDTSIRARNSKIYAHVCLQALAEHRSDVPAFGVESAETLGPADEFAMIDALLPIQPHESRILGTQFRLW
jgi:hypothetical protein